jgi:hypothetical protein
MFHKRGPLPDWPVWTRECVVERSPQGNAQEGQAQEEEKKKVERDRLEFRLREDFVSGKAGPECSQSHRHCGRRHRPAHPSPLIYRGRRWISRSWAHPPEPRSGIPSQAWRDEKDWESLDRDLMQENEEDLMASGSQAATSINRTESTPLTNLSQSSPMAGIQKALHAARMHRPAVNVMSYR